MTTGESLYPSLRDRAVLVTGGASGIGAHIVAAFARQGARVAFLDRDAAASHDVAAATGAAWRLCDLNDIGAMQAALDTLRDEVGPFTVLVNNAARDDRHDWREVTPDYWDERFATNLRHMFFAIQSIAPGMARAGGGSIINIGSNSWWEAVAGLPVYATAKSAVHGLTRSMARELGRDRIRVNTVVPGWIMTERQKALWVTPEALSAHLKRQCLPDPIAPEAVARMVLFLASDDSAMCTASNFMVDGGSI
ncbi:MAG: SDR family NAD(P)-dependent oxidoreductase [Albidovulum sp.]